MQTDEELRELVKRLREHLEVASSVEPSEEPSRQRDASMQALVGVIQFIHEIPEISNLGRPLEKLRNALIDVSDGKPNPLFDRADLPPPLGVDDQQRRAMAVISVECLVSAHNDVSAALNQVVAAFEAVDLDRKGGRGGLSSGKLSRARLEKWREEAMPRGRDDRTRERVVDFVDRMKSRGLWPMNYRMAQECVAQLAKAAIHP